MMIFFSHDSQFEEQSAKRLTVKLTLPGILQKGKETPRAAWLEITNCFFHRNDHHETPTARQEKHTVSHHELTDKNVSLYLTCWTRRKSLIKACIDCLIWTSIQMLNTDERLPNKGCPAFPSPTFSRGRHRNTGYNVSTWVMTVVSSICSCCVRFLCHRKLTCLSCDLSVGLSLFDQDSLTSLSRDSMQAYQLSMDGMEDVYKTHLQYQDREDVGGTKPHREKRRAKMHTTQQEEDGKPGRSSQTSPITPAGLLQNKRSSLHKRLQEAKIKSPLLLKLSVPRKTS